MVSLWPMGRRHACRRRQGFNDRTWLIAPETFTAMNFHVVERYTRLSPDIMQYQATIEDPRTFTKPEDQHAALPTAGAGARSLWTSSASSSLRN
jgi:hypothetical protein